ncbi:MAG: hypothetical protein DDT21_02418 [Syntrophomonadaceae bacterium]|nr:hypothetical protein [Bacillota bacterium]
MAHVGDFYAGASERSDLVKTSAGYALYGFSEGGKPPHPPVLAAPASVVVGQFSFTEATIGVLVLFGAIYWATRVGLVRG